MISRATQDLSTRIQSALADCNYPGLRNLHIDLSDSGVRITGTVATFYQKQLAQELVRLAAEGLPVSNDLEVRQRSDE